MSTADPRYEDLGLIGVGGSGEVRRARDLTLNRVVAMKILHDPIAQHPGSLARFAAEAHVTAQLEHPCIVPVYDYGLLGDGRAYFTMKEIRGETLQTLIAQVHQAIVREQWMPTATGWTFRKLIDVFFRVCETLAYAHTRGVLHRDIKPENIMLGPYGEIMVLDWGISKVRGAASPDASDAVLGARAGPRITRTGTITGTPAYMSPEQAFGDTDAIGPPTDIYSLGAVLYEILSGRPPYDGRDAMAILRQVRAGAPEPPERMPMVSAKGRTMGFSSETIELTEEASQLVPEALRAVCLRAMARKGEDRYPTADALAADVAEWLEGSRRRELALAMVRRAEDIVPEARRLRRESTALASQARELLATLPPNAPIDAKRPAWSMEDEAKKASRSADLMEMEITQLVHATLVQVPELPEGHDLLAEQYRHEHAEAERRRDGVRAARLERLLRAHDTGRHTAYLHGEGRLTLLTDPPRARVELARFEEQDRRLVAVFQRSLGHTPLVDVPLPMGSYVLTLRSPGRAVVRYPVLIQREQHWNGRPPGAMESVPVYLPRREELGTNEAYVPAGWFLAGEEGDSAGAGPAGEEWSPGFVIQRLPVTNREYLAFLNDLVATGRESDALDAVPRERPSQPGDREKGAMVYGRRADGCFFLQADADGDLWDADWPVVMITWHAAAAYAAWLAEASGLPWRLAREFEREKAGRGVDGRAFPWGEHFDPTWACVRLSHDGRAVPAKVYTFASDVSPYGVEGLAGNVRDWCLDSWSPGAAVPLDVLFGSATPTATEARAIRGGSFSSPVRMSHLAARDADVTSSSKSHLGFRLARSLR